MKTKQFYSIMMLACVMTCVPSLTKAQYRNLGRTSKVEADIYWDTAPIYLVNYLFKDTVYKKDTPRIDVGPQMEQDMELKSEGNLKAIIYKETFCRLYRDWGIEFWRRFPNDPRRFKWLENTLLNFKPYYFASIRDGAISILDRSIVKLDTVGINEWRTLQKTFLKEALSSNELNEVAKKNIWLSVIKSMVFGDRYLDTEDFMNQTLNYARAYGADRLTDNHSPFYILYRDRKNLGLDDQDIQRCIKLLKATEFPAFHETALQFENKLNLEKNPLQLKAKSISGKVIDLNLYRGKLVLVDFWNLYCTTCIAKMPEIKEVYDKYKGQGFEVISVCLFYNNKHDKDEDKRILGIHKKIAANWPLILLPSEKQNEPGRVIWKTYGFGGVPQLLLLDETGKLIHYQGEMSKRGGLENLVREHLESKLDKTQKTK